MSVETIFLAILSGWYMSSLLVKGASYLREIACCTIEVEVVVAAVRRLTFL